MKTLFENVEYMPYPVDANRLASTRPLFCGIWMSVEASKIFVVSASQMIASVVEPIIIRA
jgi:hypothetical protein